MNSRIPKELTKEENNILLCCLNKHAPKLIEKLDKLYSGMLDIDSVNEMRSAVGDELADKGFRPDWEVNDYGAKLEHLIDRLADLYIWPKEKKG